MMSVILVNSVVKSDFYEECEAVSEIKTFDSIDLFLKDPNVLLALKNNGFVNENEQREMKSRLKTDGKIFLYTLEENYPYHNRLREIKGEDDLKISDDEAKAFAKGNASIFLGASSGSVLDKKAINLIKAMEKKIKDKIGAEAKAAEAKKLRDQKRKIEKAKKTLEKAGIPLDFMGRMNDK